jgi:hypothetical protein
VSRYATRDRPPTEWADAPVTAVDAAAGVYAEPATHAGGPPTLWHWCTRHHGWLATGTRYHVVVDASPLTLYPSCLWRCCGLHGWIRGGRWEPA